MYITTYYFIILLDIFLMQRKNLLIFLIICLALIGILTIFLINTQLTGKVISDSPINIGFTTALTGNYAYIGQDVLKGVQEAIDESNKENILPKLNLLVEDNGADPKTALTDYKLLKTKGTNVVFASFSSITEALAPVSNKDKTILMYEAIPTSYAEKYDYVFKVYSNAEEEAQTIINGIEQSPGKTAIVSVNNPNSEVMKELISKKFTNIDSYGFDINEIDFKTIILRLKQDNIENVIFLGYPKQMLGFVKQSVELNYDLKKMFTSSDGGSKDVVDNIESYTKNSQTRYILTGYGPLSKEIYYIFSYDMTRVLTSGMESCQKQNRAPDDPECLKEELQKIKINGKSGFIDMNNSRIAKFSPRLYTVKNKEIVPYI